MGIEGEQRNGAMKRRCLPIPHAQPFIRTYFTNCGQFPAGEAASDSCAFLLGHPQAAQDVDSNWGKALFAGLCGPQVSTHNVLVLLIIRGVAWEVVAFFLPCSVSRYRVSLFQLHMLDTRPLE